MKNFTEISNTLKELLNLKSDKALAELLKIKTSTFSERKITNSIPHNEIIELCINQKLNINNVYNSNKKNNVDFKGELLKKIERLNDDELEHLYYVAKFIEKNKLKKFKY